MVIEDTLFILFRRIHPETIISSWLDSTNNKNESISEAFCLLPDEKTFYTSLQSQFPHYSVNEAEYAYQYAKKIVYSNNGTNTGVFGLLYESVKDLLTTDARNECLCNYKSLLKFRELTHPIDPLIFQAAYLARTDLMSSYKRDIFSWPTNMHTNNERLHHILDRGMSENHFHISGSSNAFQFSWICLMNNYSPERKKEFDKESIDSYQLDANYTSSIKSDSYYLLTFKAACIRLFLYLRLNDQWVIPRDLISADATEEQIEDRNIKWLSNMLNATEAECDLYSKEVNNKLHALKSLCNKDINGFVADYALKEEPFAPYDDDDEPFYHNLAVRNYERRLFYPLSGEQRFLYNLFLSIYKGDEKIQPFLDLAYAYLLIYCKIRSELMQINNRVGFGNFLKYQDRKELFTANYPEYEDLRMRVAQQSVLLNPQIVSFEGRLCPSSTPSELISKISKLKEQAQITNINDEKLQAKLLECSNRKLHYVLHIPKTAQEYSSNDIDLVQPRDSKLREKIKEQAYSIIEARRINPDVMSIISGIDACANEIDCRPEVFAPEFRHIRQHRYKFDGFLANHPRASLRITYHAGEDFLDPIDGIRAIDEAITFLEMQGGDRLGHALALGIDCEEWYYVKKHTVLLKKQALLDNLVWLYGKMHHYNIHNTAAEDQIFKWFKKLYTEIYTNSLSSPNKSIIFSIDVMDYYASLGLRGNDPQIYFHNPEGSTKECEAFERDLHESEIESWKTRHNAGINYDPISNVLYHYYHFNNNMKCKSDERIEYYVPKCIIDAICAVQEKIQYEISHKNISVECNPSSNFLIGTFKNYLKHPIFRFNNKYLFSANDKRSLQKNPRISASINTDDLGIFETSLENEYALMACALEKHNEYCNDEDIILPDNIYMWLDYIRQQGCYQSFIQTITFDGR